MAVEHKDIDSYIGTFAPDIQERLTAVRSLLRSAFPEASERIAWDMPTLWQGENIIFFAAFRNHLSVFPGGKTADSLRERIVSLGYKTSVGGVQFPHNAPLPLDLIREIAEARKADLGKADLGKADLGKK